MIWLLTNITSGHPYDRVNNIIVRAASEARARARCVGTYCNDGETIDWEDPAQAMCELIKANGEEEIILIGEMPG